MAEGGEVDWVEVDLLYRCWVVWRAVCSSVIFWILEGSSRALKVHRKRNGYDPQFDSIYRLGYVCLFLSSLVWSCNICFIISFPFLHLSIVGIPNVPVGCHRIYKFFLFFSTTMSIFSTQFMKIND